MEEVLTDRDACEDLYERTRSFKQALCNLFFCDICPMRSHSSGENPCVLSEPLTRLHHMCTVYAKGGAEKTQRGE